MSAYVGILCQINYCNSKLMASFSFFPFAIPAALRMRIVNSTTSSTALNDLESYESKHMCNLTATWSPLPTGVMQQLVRTV